MKTIILKKVTAVNKAYFDNYGKGGYDKNYKSYGFDLADIKKAFRIAKVKPKTVVDFGCGTGKTILDFRKAGFDAYGFEIADHAFDIMDENVKKYCRQVDINELEKWQNEKWDVAYLNLLMYLNKADIVAVLSQLKEVVNMGIYLVVPYSDYPESIPDDKDRVTLETKKWWRDTIKEAGFDYVKGTENFYIKRS